MYREEEVWNGRHLWLSCRTVPPMSPIEAAALGGTHGGTVEGSNKARFSIPDNPSSEQLNYTEPNKTTGLMLLSSFTGLSGKPLQCQGACKKFRSRVTKYRAVNCYSCLCNRHSGQATLHRNAMSALLIASTLLCSLCVCKTTHT